MQCECKRGGGGHSGAWFTYMCTQASTIQPTAKDYSAVVVIMVVAVVVMMWWRG
jgi:hypothetical protein